MNKKPSFFRQAFVLIDRYFHIFFNDKQNLLLTLFIPLLTILIVCLVAVPDMYSVKTKDDHQINDGYPVLVWQQVVQEEKDKANGGTKEIEVKSSEEKKWDGEEIDMTNIAQKLPAVFQKIGDEDFLLITEPSQLAALSKVAEYDELQDYLHYNYILQCDMDFDQHSMAPIGTKENPFTGTFDGNAHIIKNLNIDGDENVALFASVSSEESNDTTESINVLGEDKDMTCFHNGIVKNLALQDAEISADGDNAAAIAAEVGNSARISGCTVKKSLVEGHNQVGAIVGAANSGNVEIYNHYAVGCTISGDSHVGGLVGQLGEARLSAAYFIGGVEAQSKDSAGMIAGSFEGDESEHFKNAFYCGDSDNLAAVQNQDFKNIAYRLEEEDLMRKASFLVPFKGIRTAYDIQNNAYHDDEWQKRVEDTADYSAEKDKDLDDDHSFKKDGQLAVFNGTQTGLFMLACVAVFVGICNSIQEICKERNILKREYMTNLRLGSYVVSKLVVQSAVCAVQMIVVVGIFALFVMNKDLPSKGVFTSIWIEYYITLFLLAFAADTMALVISSLVKNSSTANTFIPIVLIVQIVFSGVLFEMKGVMDVLSNLMVNKWGIAALAASTGINDAQPKFLISNPSMQLTLGSSMATAKSLYESTLGNLLFIWAVLLVFILVCSVLCRFLLIRVKNDKR
ncbi:MAG: ABC transporter permease [Clostridia bacterium]|nr:ABC transporter permease [Clostridia bacterium]